MTRSARPVLRRTVGYGCSSAARAGTSTRSLRRTPRPTIPSPTDPEDDEQPENDEDEPPSRRKRSTKRRQDVPDLPRLPVEERTVGQAFTTPSGKTYRPSMFVTLTLPSYGRVTKDGTPRDGDYNYRRAALGRDALPEGRRSPLAEPSPCCGLPGPVLRHRRVTAPPGAASARCYPWRHPPGTAADRSWRRRTTRSGGRGTTSRSTGPTSSPSGVRARRVRRPADGLRAADLAGGARRDRRGPRRQAGSRRAVREAARHAGDHRHRGRRRLAGSPT